MVVALEAVEAVEAIGDEMEVVAAAAEGMVVALVETGDHQDMKNSESQQQVLNHFSLI